MRVFNIIFIFVFVSFAALQLNDPDPLIWCLIYLYGAFLSYLYLKSRFLAVYYLPAMVLYLLYALYLFLGPAGVLSWAADHGAENIAQSMKAGKPWIEATREFFGLIILLSVSAINVYSTRRQRNLQLRAQVQEIRS